MPLFSDYHNHPLAHDPHRRYSYEIFQEWADAARQAGITDLAFTDHDRYHGGVDLELLFRFRESLEGGLKIRTGIELDNDPESSAEGRRWTENNRDRLDFVLGSIHFIGDWPYDHPDHTARYAEWDIDRLYRVYFAEIRRIAGEGIYDALAHLDLIKIFGFAPQGEWDDVIEETLNAVKQADLAMEVSTAGWHKKVTEQYPSRRIIEQAFQKGIPITTASDAHASAHVGRDFHRLYALLRDVGYREVALFENHKRFMRSIL